MVGLLNGSPKAPGGTSDAILKQVQSELDQDSIILSAKNASEDIYTELDNCKAVVIVFPIYADTLPSHLLRFLIGWEAHRKQHKNQLCRLYAISHAGFYDGTQCRWSLDILHNFCVRTGLIWCGGVGLGGAVVLGEGGVPKCMLKPLRGMISLLAQEVKHDGTLLDNHFANVGMPRWLYKAMGNMGWKKTAKQNKLPQKELRRQE